MTTNEKAGMSHKPFPIGNKYKRNAIRHYKLYYIWSLETLRYTYSRSLQLVMTCEYPFAARQLCMVIVMGNMLMSKYLTAEVRLSSDKYRG